MPTGDIFDQVTAPTKGGDIFDKMAPAQTYSSPAAALAAGASPEAILAMHAPLPQSQSLAEAQKAPLAGESGNKLVDSGMIANMASLTPAQREVAQGRQFENLKQSAPMLGAAATSMFGPEISGPVGIGLRALMAGGGAALGSKIAGSTNPEASKQAAIYGGTEAAGELASKIPSLLPSTVRAGQTFQRLSKLIGQHPVSVTDDLSNSLLDIQKASDAGSSMPQVARKLINRLTTPEKGPLTYDEARLFSSNVSRLSSEEASRLTPNMRRLMGRMADALNKTVAGTAENAGQLTDFQGAMKEYRQASQLKSAAKTVGKTAGGVAGVGLGYYIAHRLLFDTLRDVIGGGHF